MPNATLVNFAGGETSPNSRGRFDLDWFRSSCEKLLNFTAEVPGSARYRCGFKFAGLTRGGAAARLIPFQLNDSQAYMLEFTAGYMRIYKDGALQMSTVTTVSSITKANPAIINVASTTGLSVGDEVIITGIVGMEELNGRQVKLGANLGTTYQLLDPVTGAGIDSRNFTTYVSGGTLKEVYEIASPYLADDLDDIQFAQNNSTMYLVHYRYAPRKLTVDGSDTWTLTTYSRTNDPFTAGGALQPSYVYRGGQNDLTVPLASGKTMVRFIAGTLASETALYTFTDVEGTTEINGTPYRLVSASNTEEFPYTFTFPTYYVKTAQGLDVASDAWGAYSNSDDGNRATPAIDNPIAVAFYESRLWFLGTDQRPNTIFGSRAPSDAGANRFDDFTSGAAADDACFFSLAPASGAVDYIAWGRGTSKYLLIGTFGGPFRVSGSGVDEPITPSSINIRQFDAAGCEAAMPVGGTRVFYIQRGGTALRTIKYNVDSEDLDTYDLLLNAEQISHSRIRRLALQTGRPDIIWAVREDGTLAGMSTNGAENVAGWHRHKVGGTDALVLDVQTLPRTDKDDQLWIVAERTIDGVTRRYVEIQADPVVFPDLEDFYTGPDNEEDDLERWKNAVYRRQEEYVHLDCAGTYNGADRGSAASATLTPGALTGEDVTFTASAAVFRSTDVGSELWKKPNRETGEGSGRAVITAFVSTTQVTCDIVTDFDAVTAIAAGAWHFAVDTIYVPYLGRETVAVVTDGAVYSNGLGTVGQFAAVENGAVQLSEPAAVVHVGFPYEGFLKTHNLAITAGGNGPAQAKPRLISEAVIRFLYTLGVDFGTDLYNLDKIEWRTAKDAADRPAPVFSGQRRVPVSDTTEREEGKFVIVSQRLPLPCTVQSIDLQFDTTEAG